MTGATSMATDGLVCIVYYSSARHAMDGEALSRLLETSRKNNAAYGVTGMLLYHAGNFIQALEGPREAVARVFERIKQDAAHRNILAVGPMSIEQRYFPDWTMGDLRNDVLTPSGRDAVTDFLRYREEIEFDPSSIAWRLLNAFRESAHLTR